MTLIDDQLIAAQQDKIAQRTSTAKRWIWVNFSKEGIHCFPAALTEDSLSDVSFLGYPHRHIFHFNVKIQVTHNDRDIEFILAKRWCENLYTTGALDLNAKSCEMMADDLYSQIAAKWPGRDIVISVSEDQENGCSVEYLL